jgi:uncharacterized OB-fold protein
MAKTNPPLVKYFYDQLRKGKMYGVKCKKCKNFMFPPKAGCDKCGAHKMELKRISGDGKLLFYSSGILPPKKFVKYAPYAYGVVKLKEGPCFFTQIEGVDYSGPSALQRGNEMLPRPVKARVKKVAGLEIVVFKVKK